jgi:hypothetical protein
VKGKINMAKIIDLPTLRKLTEHDQQELLIQLLETREKLTNVLDLSFNKEMTTDLRQRLLDELETVNSILTNAGEVLRSAYIRKR